MVGREHEADADFLNTLRDLLGRGVERVQVDAPFAYERMIEFARTFMPDSLEKIELYRGNRPILDLYGVEDEIVGVLGVVGPTRMPYARAIATVRAIAAVMSDLVSELHGESRSERDDHTQDTGTSHSAV